MTAIPSFAFSEMDASHLDDKMDVASSPFRQQDDFDVDLDSVRDPSVIESLHDDMVDDSLDFVNTGGDGLQEQFDETLPDDDMVDEPDAEAPPEQHDVDYNMDAFVDEGRPDEDEDILYEDEEENVPDVEADEGAVEIHASEDPKNYQEVEAEVLVEEFEEQPRRQDLQYLATNESTNPIDGDIPADDNAAPKEIESVESDNIEKAVEQAGDQGEESLEPAEQAPVDLRDEAPDSYGQEPRDHPEMHPPPQADTEANVDSANEPTQEPIDLTEDQTEQTLDTEQQKGTEQTVHPVILVYLEEEMSLFPPMVGDASSVYFLADSSLAFEPLDKLLGACREILTGTLDHHDELVLDVAGLGLHICEDSKYAAQITLSQILDVYLQLCHNDDGQNVQPLYCHLSSRVSLASQYAYLSSVAVEGKTYAEVAADHMDTPEPEDDQVGVTETYQDGQDASRQSSHRDGIEASSKEEQIIEENLNSQASKPPDDSDHQDASDMKAFDHADITTESNKQAPNDAINVEEAEQEYDATVAPSETSPDAGESGQPDIDDVADVSTHDQGNTDNHIQNFDPSLEQDEYTVAEEHPDEGQENDTNSSHTVRADPTDDGIENVESAHPVVEGEGFESNEPAHDVRKDDNLAPQSEAEFESYNDEELFPQEADEDLTEDLVAAFSEDVQDGPETSVVEPSATEQDASLVSDNDTTSGPNESHSSSTAALKALTDLSPPLTPAQGKPAKRKADVDDDFEFLDFDTPEPKRRRPS